MGNETFYWDGLGGQSCPVKLMTSQAVDLHGRFRGEWVQQYWGQLLDSINAKTNFSFFKKLANSVT